MDDWFCESRNHRREASLRAEEIERSESARTRGAPGELCFPLTMDLHG
jgi:hypothetical protein